ncbi:DUF6526 family protein [Paenibacillus terrigena]|uniref:DUF6526 family protein n=1 Tax=Paenibacillus terrigena TaxID=369333 RepID=UPI0003634A67|nr:DUF6526 family protein [Paenibacillus terrigena]
MSQPSQQTYQNHKKVDPMYHFALSLIVLIVLIASIVYAIQEAFSYASVLLLGMAIAIVLLTGLLRIYSTKLQDRIIRQEENFRYYRLTGKPIDPSLTMKQIIALRFAADEEFPALCSKTAETGMQPDAIKRAITKWRADLFRV